ncbi:MAG: hypothetical protein WKF63_01740 [Thermomicrobiales bacterium]
MEETSASHSNVDAPGLGRDDEPAKQDRIVPIRVAIWAILSLAFVAFLVFGSVDARIWRFGQLHIESKSILRIWQVQGQSLPDVTHGWMLQFLFHGSSLVFVVCVILAMRYLLFEAIEEAPAEPEQS